MRATDDANEVWQHHYLNACDPSAKKEQRICSHSDCKTKLGPSNSFRCNNCQDEFCPSHRYKEQHSCRKRSRQERAPSRNGYITLTSTKKSSVDNRISSRSIKSKKNEIEDCSTKKVEVIDLTTSLSPTGLGKELKSDSIKCPFGCINIFESHEALRQHLNRLHQEKHTTKTKTMSTKGKKTKGKEMKINIEDNCCIM